MKTREADKWIPFWVDKWLFGSTRLEFDPAERAVWIDILALASKDDGYIRANEGVPYRDEQIAGFLCVPIELYQRTIEKCLLPLIDKLEKYDDGTMKVKSWGKYELSSRQKRRVMSENSDMASDKTDIEGGDADTKNRIDKTRLEKTKSSIKAETAGQLFDEFWTAYPKEGRFHKKACAAKFASLVKSDHLDDLRDGLRGYLDHLKDERINKHFDKRPMHLMTFLGKERYLTYKGFQYREPM